MWYLYALLDPRSGAIRYVGVSANVLQRYEQHCEPPRGRRRRTYKEHWIASLAKRGLAPKIEVLGEFPSAPRAAMAEVLLIKQLRELGFRLTNTTAGGELAAATA
jgi:predicted GIY-YIG superfamily endonuclease